LLARAWGPVLEAGLTITSITFGPVLGVFCLALLGRAVREDRVLIALGAGLVGTVGAHLLTPLAWTWLTPLGAVLTLGLGWTRGSRVARGREG
jgi:hypothetical protein